MTSCHQFQPNGTSIQTLWAHLPFGYAWDAFRTAGKNAYRLLSGLASAFEDASQALCDLGLELDYRSAVQLLPEWERAVSLPDACLPVAETLAQRRAWVRFRLDKRRWSKEQDWHDLAELYGLEISITPGWIVQKPALYASCYPKRYDRFPKLGRFRVYVDVTNIAFGGYPYDGTVAPDYKYPLPYGAGTEQFSAFKCILERVKPANVVILWNKFPDICGCNGVTFSAEFTEEFC